MTGHESCAYCLETSRGRRMTITLTRAEFYDVLVALQIADTMNPLADQYERLRARLAAEDNEVAV